MDRRSSRFALVAACAATLPACGAQAGSTSGWAGTIDTLPSGTVIVSNPDSGTWTDETRWHLVETLRLGSAEETGPQLFGTITDFDVDTQGRIYVFDGQAKELRMFDADGTHSRTVGREGAGPGEFKGVIGMAWGADGNLWIVDPSNNRVSLIDTAGTYVGSHWVLGSISMYPWPGTIDTAGYFYNYAPPPSSEVFRDVLVRYSPDMQPVDTVFPPEPDPSVHSFEHTGSNSSVSTSIPYTTSIWHLVPTGDIWFAFSNGYQLFKTSLTGDTVEIVRREYQPIPVTDADIESATARLEWFTRQGGTVDRSKIPSHKPAIRGFFVDDDGRLWVSPTVEGPRRFGTRVLDVFDSDGRYLGRVVLPFELMTTPEPIVRNGNLYGVSLDENMVSFLVAAEIEGLR